MPGTDAVSGVGGGQMYGGANEVMKAHACSGVSLAFQTYSRVAGNPIPLQQATFAKHPATAVLGIWGSHKKSAFTMNKIIALALGLVSLNAFGQKNPTALAKPIVKEGKLLYKSEMASWYGTDLFLEKFKGRKIPGGYFSYLENDVPKCIFFSKADKPTVIAAFLFDDTYNVKTAKTDSTERAFTKFENDLFTIRKLAIAAVNSDTLFKKYQNTSLNLIPLISGKEKRVYVLTAPTQNGVIIFGNDYLLTFGKNNDLASAKRLHKNIIFFEYGPKKEEEKADELTMHTHSPETGDFITATDVCTLMLYEKFAKWKQHNVVSKKYYNMWNCSANQLFVISREFVASREMNEKTSNDRKERNKRQPTR